MTEHGVTAVRAAVQTTPHAFSSEDFEPRPIGATKQGTSQKRSSVFVSGGDWASPSSRAIMDALHDMSATEAANADEAKAQLPFMRNAGSMMVNGKDADLFDAETVRATGIRKETNTHLVECVYCHRPVLATRFLTHLRDCAAFRQKAATAKDGGRLEGDLITLGKADEELDLVSAPYKSTTVVDATVCINNTSGDAFAAEAVVLDISLPYFSGTAEDVCVLQKRGSQWQKRLTPLLPVRGARGRRARRMPKVALVPLVEPTPVKKKQEKRMLAAAATVGLGRATPAGRDEGDPLKFAGGDWGVVAPWTKLMKIVRPSVFSRSHIRRSTMPRETPLSLFAKSPTHPGQFLFAENVNSKMVPQRGTMKITRTITKPHPSLPGALLYVRGKHNKNLQHTSLGGLDYGAANIPKSPFMFHGQSYFAQPGTYMSDQKSAAEVVLPASVDTPGLRTVQQQRTAASNVAQGQAAQQARRAAAMVSPVQPPAKRQRTTGKQQARGAPVNPAMGNAPTMTQKQAQAAQRKMQAQRQMANNKANANFQQQLPQRNALPAAARNVAGNAAAAASAMNMNMKRAQAQPAQPKRQYRSAPGAQLPANAIAAAALNPSELAAANVAASKAAPRNARGRQPQHSIPVTNAQAQKMMQQAAARGPYGQQNVAMLNRGAAGMGARAGMNMENFQRTAAAGDNVNYQNVLASVVGGAPQAGGRPGARVPMGGRAPVRSDMVDPASLQAQRAAMLAQMSAAGQAGRMQAMSGRQNAMLPGYGNPQVRASEAQRQSPSASASAALRARQANMRANAAQMFPGGQIPPGMAGMYNGAFPVPAHERSQGMPQANAANNPQLLMHLMQQGATAGAPLPNQLSPTAPKMPASAANLQDMRAMAFGQGGLGMPNNVMNYFPGATDPAAARNLMQAAGMAGTGNPLTGMLPTDNTMMNMMPNARAGAHPNMMHMQQNNVPGSVPMGAGAAQQLLPPGNGAAATPNAVQVQALSDIDRALSL